MVFSVSHRYQDPDPHKTGKSTKRIRQSVNFWKPYRIRYVGKTNVCANTTIDFIKIINSLLRTMKFVSFYSTTSISGTTFVFLSFLLTYRYIPWRNYEGMQAVLDPHYIWFRGFPPVHFGILLSFSVPLLPPPLRSGARIGISARLPGHCMRLPDIAWGDCLTFVLRMNKTV